MSRTVEYYKCLINTRKVFIVTYWLMLSISNEHKESVQCHVLVNLTNL